MATQSRKLTATQLKKAGAITNQEAIVLAALRHNGKQSNRDLSVYTVLPINIITPRVFALRKKGFVTQAGTKFDKETNRTVRVWTA